MSCLGEVSHCSLWVVALLVIGAGLAILWSGFRRAPASEAEEMFAAGSTD
jgi:hypothetical protein